MASNLSNVTPIHGAPVRKQSDHDLKRKCITSPEVNDTVCSKCSNEHNGNKVVCFGCNLPFCARCSGLSLRSYELFKCGGFEDFNYTCKSCKRIIPTLDSIDQKLSKISENQDKRIEQLEIKMKEMDLYTKLTIQTEFNEMKQDFAEEIDNKITKVVEEKTRELEDRRRRELNIVVFNLDEGSSTQNLENKISDEIAVVDIASQLGLQNLEIETSYRLGKRNKDTTRPLKIILKNRQQRKYLLEHSKDIRNNIDKKYSRIIIVKDLTQEQRKIKREKRESRNKQKQDNIRYNQPHTEEKQNMSFLISTGHQDENINPMLVDTNNDENHNCTLINVSHITGDETIVGGINMSNKGIVSKPPPPGIKVLHEGMKN